MIEELINQAQAYISQRYLAWSLAATGLVIGIVNCRSQERLELDHITPVSKGGGNTARNLQLLCERCNRKKGARIV